MFRRLISPDIRPAAIVTIAYQLLIMITVIFYFDAVPGPFWILLYHVVIIALVLKLPFLPDQRWKWLKDFYPAVVIPTNFSELHYLVHNVNPIDMDNALIAIDHWLFGVHPTVWLERLTHPLFTEYLQVIYTTFYFLPIILAVLLIRRGEYEKFHYFLYIIVLGFYVSYIGYFMVPAIGPRFTLDHLQSFPLEGLWLTGIIRHTLDVLENIQRDAFPSGHTEMTVLTMIYAFKYHRRYFYVLLIVGTSLVFSTVYLRYHYVIDVIAGTVLAFLVAWIGEWLYAEILNKLIKKQAVPGK